jgi:hypothetical protein
MNNKDNFLKKLAFLIISLFIGFTLFGCNETTTDIEIIEMISAPTNLRIEGTTLYWDTVSGVKSYVVYIDNVETKTLKTTSYDFSNLTGDTLVFKVKSVAPRGMADSPLSVSIAYQRNRAATITGIDLYLESAAMSDIFPEGFVEVLTDKGMTAQKMETFMTAFNSFMMS